MDETGRDTVADRGRLGGRAGSRVIAVRVPSDQRDALEALAALEGVEVSELMREALAERIAAGPRRRNGLGVIEAA